MMSHMKQPNICLSTCLWYRDAHDSTFSLMAAQAAKLGGRLSADSKMLVRDGL